MQQDPQEQFEQIKKSVLDAVNNIFPVESRDGLTEVRIKNLQIKNTGSVDDIKTQQDAKLQGKSWVAKLYGTVQVVDKKTGKVLSEKRQQISQLPQMTRHFSYIIQGKERYVANQWRLRPGAYIKKNKENGEVKAQFQLAKGKPFSIEQDKSGALMMRVSGSGRKIPAYAVMSAMGVSDSEMRSAWGDEIFEETTKKTTDRHLPSFIQAWTGSNPGKNEDPTKLVRDIFQETKMDPLVAKMNLGLKEEQVTGKGLLNASKKMMEVSAGKKDPDPIDSLKYKELWTVPDHLTHRISKSSKDIQRRVQSSLNKKSTLAAIRNGDNSVLRDVVAPDLIQRPLFSLFNTSLESTGKQTNLLTMLGNASLTTIKGEGGLSNSHQIRKENQVLDGSHLGFLDPVYTPESDPGVNSHLAMNVVVKDRKPHTEMFNLRTGKVELVDAAEAASSNVAMPDQVEWKRGKPSFTSSTIRMSNPQGNIVDGKKGDADYVMLAPSQVFATETNLVPFMQNDSAGRSSMSARHMGQAISVVGREPPKVQVASGSGTTFEESVGSRFLAIRSPIEGTVSRLTPDHIYIKDAKGKTRKVDIYNNYPTNDTKGLITSEPLVKKGDRVKPGQILADNNHTKNGVLAIGTNLLAAYLSNGQNHEDGIVVSESAAKKLSSEHLYKPSFLQGKSTVMGKKEFLLQKTGVYPNTSLKNMDDRGVIKPGTIVKPGEPLILGLRKDSAVDSVNSRTSRKLGSRLKSQYSNSSITWDSDYEGEVVRVAKAGNTWTVHVKTREPAQEGSKLSTRHSAKGIISRVLPDDEMPRDKDGKPVQVLLNPTGVIGRSNPGQLLETVAGKIADKTGKPYVIKNFDGGVDYLEKVKRDIKKHGISETEELFDPKTGRKIGDVTVGPHYMFQLEHQIDKKTTARAGGNTPSALQSPKLPYSTESGSPQRGGKHGGQALGSLGNYGALANQLDSNLEEMMTSKSDFSQSMELWGAITNGERIPPPKVPFTFKKFEALLGGMGVDLKKEGSKLKLIPLTDAEIEKKSSGEIKSPDIGMRIGPDGKERADRNGLFGKATGGPNGERWSHINLAEPMPHPAHAKSIALALGLGTRNPTKSLQDIIAGEATLNGKTGSAAITDAIGKINIDKRMERLRRKIDDKSVRGTELNKATFEYKALRSLKREGKSPKDVWTISKVPVLPPTFRRQITMLDGTTKSNPLNQLYRRVGMVNGRLKEGEKVGVPYDSTLDTRAGLFQELNNLMGTTPASKKANALDFRGTGEDPNKQLPGILHMISGDKPKDGFFQDKMFGKRQDYTARATITVDPNLSMDEIGVPKKIALEVFRPMVARRLTRMHGDPVRAYKQIANRDPVAIKALEKEIETRPVIMKRDPVLHKYSLVGQKVKLTDTKAIRVSPLVLPPIGGDIDGDTIALFAPISDEARTEAMSIMPSNRPLSDSSGDVMYKPSNESALSLFRMSIPRGKSDKKYNTLAEAELDFTKNKLELNHLVEIGGVKTTLGRARFSKLVPGKYKKDILTKLDQPIDRKWQGKILKEVARNDQAKFKDLANGMSRLGFQMAYESGHTLRLSDVTPLRRVRDAVFAETDKKVKGVRSKEKRNDIWAEATDKIHDLYTQHFAKHPTDVSDMRTSGIKAKKEQFQGSIIAPILTQDPFGRASDITIRKSFAEGIDLGGYFEQAKGARGGQIDKTQSVSDPGYMSKKLVRANIDQNISRQDCGTREGITMSIGEKDVVDRYLSEPFSAKGKVYERGTAVTPGVLSAAKAAGKSSIKVRSPLRCAAPDGVCAKCMGVHPNGKSYEVGERVGISSAQALGERAAQLMLKRTHGGGIRPTKEVDGAQFATVSKLFDATKQSPADGLIANTEGVISRVQKRFDGRYAFYLQGKVKPLISNHKPLPKIKPGYKVRKGEALTGGKGNLHNILSARGLQAAQDSMSQDIGDIYAAEGVLRRHAELTVRTATSTVQVTDSGDHPSILRGDEMMKQTIDHINATKLKGKRQIKYKTVLVPTSQIPLHRQKDFIGRLQGERIRTSLTNSITQGESSDLQGPDPVPGLVFGKGFNWFRNKLKNWKNR